MATLQLREGGRYRRRDGAVVTVTTRFAPDSKWPWMGYDGETRTNDGAMWQSGDGHEHLLDLIEELPDPRITYHTIAKLSGEFTAAELRGVLANLEAQ